MQYAQVAAVMLGDQAPVGAVPPIVVDGSPARRLRDAYEPLAMHAVWSPLVNERLAARGLDFFSGYVWARSAVMGEPSGAVVAAAFASFEPSFIDAVYNVGRAAVARDEVLSIVVGAVGESLSGVLATADADGSAADAATTADAVAAVVGQLDPTGRPLFAGVQALPQPENPYARLWQGCLALREHRGDGHVAAYLSEGFDPVAMNLLTECWLGYPIGEYSGTRAWPPARTAVALQVLNDAGLFNGDQITDHGHRCRQQIEERTDRLDAAVVAGFGDRLSDVTERLGQWSAACVTARMFPPDPRKRAGG